MTDPAGHADSAGRPPAGPVRAAGRRSPAGRRGPILTRAAWPAVALAWACDSTTAPAPRPATITVTPAEAELTRVGEAVQLRALVRDQGSRVMSDVSVSWASTDASVAVVDTTGLVTAAGEGTAVIVASADSVQGTALVAVADADRQALAALYRATDGANWTRSDHWLSEWPFRVWHGVRTDSLGRVKELLLSGNNLSGPLPPELGGLAGLTRLELSGNALTGALPPELGELSNLEGLILDGNELEGPLPPELGGLPRLTRLSVAHNPALSGPLPAGLTGLGRLEALLAEGTSLCAPAEPGFQAWLERIHTRRVAACAGRAPLAAYLTQAVQSRTHPVPLVAGESALLRVFVTAAQGTAATLPPVRASFYLGGSERHVAEIPAGPGPVPTEVREGSLSASANAEIPADVIRPGLEMVIEIDPDGTLDPALGLARRIPETGRLAVEVREMPVFRLTVIPFLWSSTPDRSIVEVAEAMASDPDGHELLWAARALLPIGGLEVTAHAPVLSMSNSAFTLLSETKMILAVEGGSGRYMGMMAEPVTGASGVANVAGPASFSVAHPMTIAHELGHNLGLRHAPCRAESVLDPSYPYRDGATGAWGYDFREGTLLGPEYKDLMSYCRPRWISDYHFTNALRYRLFDEAPPRAAAASVAEGTGVLLWGGVDAAGEPFLNPAFVVRAPAALPDSAGPYRLTGRGTGGNELFALSFALPEVGDGDGSSSFAFVLPAGPEWAGSLAAVTLSGSGGSFTLDGGSDDPMTILLDRSTGQVRAVLRGQTQPAAAAALGPEPGLDALFSRGIPDASAWSP